MSDDFWVQFLANNASGVIIAFVFFLLNDYLFRIPRLNGSWIFNATTIKTKYNPYENMILTYKVLLWQNGRNISGTGEKILENAGGNKREYTGDKRTQIKISGYVTKKYLAKDRIVIHIEESGSRDSSTIHLLKKNGKKLLGNYISTIADSEGKVEWIKESTKLFQR